MQLIEHILAIVFMSFTAYLMFRITMKGMSTRAFSRWPVHNKAYKRIFVGGAIGFVLGFMIAIALQPPYEGMMDTSADVKGLVIASWFIGGWIGAILLAFIGLMTSGRGNKE